RVARGSSGERSYDRATALPAPTAGYRPPWPRPGCDAAAPAPCPCPADRRAAPRPRTGRAASRWQTGRIGRSGTWRHGPGGESVLLYTRRPAPTRLPLALRLLGKCRAIGFVDPGHLVEDRK